MNYADTTGRVVAHIQQRYGAEPEFLWSRSPNNAALRHNGTRKWFAALLLDLPYQTLGLSLPGTVDVINLKCDPKLIGSLLDGRRYLPGYHMNKEHWISLLLDGSIPPEDIVPLIELSFDLTSPKKRT